MHSDDGSRESKVQLESLKVGSAITLTSDWHLVSYGPSVPQTVGMKTVETGSKESAFKVPAESAAGSHCTPQCRDRPQALMLNAVFYCKMLYFGKPNGFSHTSRPV